MPDGQQAQSTPPQTLAQSIRAKYPNEYADIDDVTLEQKVLAKYPQYADMPRTQATPKQNPITSSIGPQPKPLPSLDNPYGLEEGPIGRTMREMFNPTQGFRQEHPVLAKVGDIGNRAAQFGNILTTMGILVPGIGEAGAIESPAGENLIKGVGEGAESLINKAQGIDRAQIGNKLAEVLRNPATSRQSALGRPGTVKNILPSQLQRYTIPDWMIPKGELGTPTNPGPFMEIPMRVKAPKVPKPTLSFEGATSTEAGSLPQGSPTPFTSSTEPTTSTGPAQPSFVKSFTQPKGKIVSPESEPPDVKVTYQSVPQPDLLKMVNRGDAAAIREWQRRGLQLPPNVGYMVESGAGTLPWRNYRR